jgi:predicted heme/steroid binding protein
MPIITRKHRYPEKRKKKDIHVQWMSFDRVLKTWGMSVDYYYMFKVDKQWWACQPSGYFIGNLDVDGDYFKPYFNVKYYDGQNGDVIIGYMGVIYYHSMAIYKGRFVFVKNALSAGEELTAALNKVDKKYCRRERKLREINSTQRLASAVNILSRKGVAHKGLSNAVRLFQRNYIRYQNLKKKGEINGLPLI